MAVDKFGYRYGPRVLLRLPVDSSTTAIDAGDMLTLGTAGYVQKAAANDTIYAIAAEKVAVPSADGGAYVLADVSSESVYEYPPDAGSVTAALLLLTCDAGGARSINIDASTDDCLQIVGCDVDANTVLVRLVRILAGVV